MAWDTIDLRTQSGMPVREKERKTILDAAERAILQGDCDPEIAVKTVTKIGLKAHSIENLWAYANRALFRAMSKERSSQARRDQELVAETRLLSVATKSPSPETDIAVRHALEGLDQLDRDIFTRRVFGESFVEIETGLNLPRGTAIRRFAISKQKLRQVLDSKA